MMEETYQPRSAGKAAGGRGFWSDIRNFDMYSKVDEEFRVQTSSGAALSVVAWILIGILVTAEIKSFVLPQTREHLIVDTTLGQKLRVNLNVTFHALTCAEAHLDAMDVAGDNQLNLEHDMLKQRISATGDPIGQPGVEIVGEVSSIQQSIDLLAKIQAQIENYEPIPPDYCGSCYGAVIPGRPCCNTCDELRNAYDAMGWNDHDVLQNATQCLRDAKNPFAHVKKGEGCRVSGHMLVNKVSGNFHIAFGDSIVRDGMHIHQFLPQNAPTYNISHSIHSISFGEPYPDMPQNPLDSVTRIITKETGTGLFQYYIKVVPTVFTSEFGFKYTTNQFTVTERFRPFSLQPGGQVVVPGIFFIYDMSAFMVEIQRTRQSLLHTFTRLCAIVGGVLATLGIVDKVLFKVHRVVSSVTKKGT